MNFELRHWVGERKDLECAMLRTYLYGPKTGYILKPIRGHNKKILPPSVGDLSYAKFEERQRNNKVYNFETTSNEQKLFTFYSRRIHTCYGERKEIENEIGTILSSNERTFRIVARVRRDGVEAAYKYYKNGKQNTPSKKVLQRLKKLCNKFSEVSDSYHYKMTPNERAILKRLLKK